MKGSTIILFGGTGNLAYKKLYPAFYNLYFERQLADDFKIISVGRRDLKVEDYKSIVRSNIQQYSAINDYTMLDGFIKHLVYHQLAFKELEDYKILKNIIDNCVEECVNNGNRIFYLATAPDYFEVIAQNLKKSGILEIEEEAFKRIVIEKPFGKNLEDAKKINKTLSNIFQESEIFRTDHYLGKSMIQNIMILRFSNTIFEPLWNKECIDNIQITVSETIGIEERGRYYEGTGALRDMVQSHLLQVLALVAMDPPKSLNTEDVRDEKVKVLRAMKPFSAKEVANNMVLGQYYGESDIPGYHDENYVQENSLTETFVAMRVEIDNPKWDGVGFYIRSGKRLKRKVAEIVIQFKDNLPFNLYGEKIKEQNNLNPNLLRIKIQPNEGVSLGFHIKEPSTKDIITEKTMDFCQNCEINMKSPEAYEKLILDALTGDQSLYTRWDEVQASWGFIDKISQTCLDRNRLLKTYSPGSWGPSKSDELMKKHNVKWWTV